MINTPKDRRYITNYYNFRDKVGNVNKFVDQFLNITLTMFTYKNLPDSIPEKDLEMMLQINGYCVFTTDDDGAYKCYWGGLSSPLDSYYRHTNILVSNPYGNNGNGFNKSVQIYPNQEKQETDGVIIRNDPLMTGMLPIVHKYAALSVEAELTLYLGIINLRTIFAITANNDSEKKSAEMFLKQIEEGKQGILIGDEWSNNSDSIKTQPYANSNQGYITQLIEANQYIKSAFFNEIGLDANGNLKRERLITAEVDGTKDCVRPLIDSMIEERKLAIKQINEKYGLNIEVEFNSSWSQYNPDNNDVSIDCGEEAPVDNKNEENIEESTDEVAEATINTEEIIEPSEYIDTTEVNQLIVETNEVIINVDDEIKEEEAN